MDSIKFKARLVNKIVESFGRLVSLLRFFPLLILAPIFAVTAAVVGLFCRREWRIASTQVKFALIARNTNDPYLHQDPQLTLANRFRVFFIVMGSFAHIGYSVAEVIKWRTIVGKKISRPRFVEAHASPSEPEPSNSEGAYQISRFDKVAQFGHVRLIGADIADSLIETNSGCVALAAHTGNFELLAASFAQYGSKLTIVARSPKYPALREVFGQIRRDYGLNLLWREDAAIARKLLVALQSGHFVALLIDQDTKLPNAFSEFFGLDAAIPISPIRLALRARVPLFTSFIYRAGWQSHEILVESICDPKNTPLSESEILRVYNERLERVIREHPMQWPWWHKRWRRRPGIDYDKTPERLPSTSQYLAWMKEQSSENRRKVAG